MRLLLAEDEKDLSDALVTVLKHNNYSVDAVYNGQDALDYLEAGDYDGAILDIMMPKMNGLAAVMKIRETNNIPIIILSAKTEETDKVLGLSMGADDYISKPFRPRELVSRMRSVLRRAGCANHMTKVGDLNVDLVKGVVTRKGEEIFLSALEYRLLLVFLNHRGTVLSRGQLLEEIWDIAGEYVNDNTLTVYIKRLREKIEKDAQNPEIIKTVRGMGYRMET